MFLNPIMGFEPLEPVLGSKVHVESDLEVRNAQLRRPEARKQGKQIDLVKYKGAWLVATPHGVLPRDSH